MFERSTSDARQQPATHRCIAGRGCRAKITENDELQPAYTEHPDVLCDGCHAHYRQNIHRLLRDYAMLRITLGERHTKPGVAVTTSPSPGIVIDATSDSLMTEITEWSGYAADLIADQLDIPRPDGSRRLLNQIRREDGRIVDLEPDSIAEHTWETTQPPEGQRLTAFINLIEQHPHVLAAVPPHDVQVWSQPKRCPDHTDLVASTKRILDLARKTADPDEITASAADLQAAYAAAGACDECCGWTNEGPGGQARQDMRLSGLDILNKLTRLHHLSRQHLGQTKLRHQYPMACPNCGHTVGRDDGETVITCDNKHCTPKGPSSWTEREYEFLSGWLADDERARLTTKWLLAEAYGQLDDLQAVLDKLKDGDTLDLPGAGRIIAERLTEILANHQEPAARKVATDKATAETRQASEDWTWKRAHPYKKPKTKPKAKPRKDIAKIAASSLSLINDDGGLYPNEYRLGTPCSDCNQIHAGECP